MTKCGEMWYTNCRYLQKARYLIIDISKVYILIITAYRLLEMNRKRVIYELLDRHGNCLLGTETVFSELKVGGCYEF